MTAAQPPKFRRNYKARSLTERFMDWLPADRPADACWIWRGAPSRQGYGRIREGRKSSQVLLAHRVSYELFVGPIPDGLHIDHRCHSQDATCIDWNACLHRMCVNPAHLEAVPPRENILRGHGLTIITAVTGVCQRGHDYQAHAYTHPKTGKRQCRACRRWRRANWNAA